MKRSTIRNKLDKITSEIVRSRGSCVRCSKTDTLQACHIFSRSNLHLRWNIDIPNVICMCAGCHFWSHQNPVLFTEFVKELLGEIKYEQLKLIARCNGKIFDHELVEMYDKLKTYQSGMWS